MTARGLVPTPEDLKPKISISSPLTDGSIKKPYVPSTESPTSTPVATPDTEESNVSNPIGAQNAMVDSLKAETPAIAIAEKSKTYSPGQSRTLASLAMQYAESRGDKVSVIPQTQLPDNWYSDPWPDDDAIFVKANTKRSLVTKWFWIEFYGDIYEIHEDTNKETFTPADIKKLGMKSK
jgi:hypothetical protein